MQPVISFNHSSKAILMMLLLFLTYCVEEKALKIFRSILIFYAFSSLHYEIM